MIYRRQAGGGGGVAKFVVPCCVCVGGGAVTMTDVPWFGRGRAGGWGGGSNQFNVPMSVVMAQAPSFDLPSYTSACI